MIKNNLQIISAHNEDKGKRAIEKADLTKIVSKGEAAVVLKAVHLNKVAEWKRLAFNKENTKNQLVLGDDRKNLPSKTKKLLPKIVGDMKHYPPANKEWKNSIYAYNKNSLRSMAALDKRAAKTIKSYFNLTSNKKLARSYRMRNLIRRSTSRRIFASKPEIKQTSNKVNITVYILNREGQYLLRKIYFYKKNMNINRDIYLHKIWLQKNLLAFRKTFKDKNSVRLLTRQKKLMTKRKSRNKTYIHNTIIKRYLGQNNSIKTSKKNNLPNFSEGKAKHLGSSLFTKTKPQKSFLSLSKLSNARKVNILKSLRKRSLIRSLKKLKVFKDARPISVAITSYNKVRELSGANSYGFKPFENYLLQKKSKKLEVKIRNRTSTVKIKNRLSKFFFVRANKGTAKRGRAKKGKGLIRRKKRFKKIRLPYSNFKFKNEVKFFSFKLVSELKHIRKLFLFRFLKYLYSILNIQIFLTKPQRESELLDYMKKNRKVNTNEQKVNDSPYFYLKYNGETSPISNDKNRQHTGKGIGSKIIKIYKARRPKVSSLAFSHSKLNKLELLNLELLNFLKFILSGKGNAGTLPLNNSENFSAIFAHLYKKYEKKYFLRYLGKYFKKEFLYINYFSKFMMNRFKLGKFLPGLKSLMNKIYSKKVKLNIVNLKYPHLNSDIFAESITSKLRKKLGLLRVMRSALRLAKLPSEYLSYDRLGEYNKLPSLTIHKTLNVDDLSKKANYGGINKSKISSAFTEKQLKKDSLDLVITKLYPYSFVTSNLLQLNDLRDPRFFANKKDKPLSEGSKSYNNVAVSPAKNLKILNLIRYKWVSGVRLEAAGRLTRRYTAARSVFKFRYKGSLKNIDYSQKLDISKRNASAVMIRNYAKANSQYSFSKSKRRIGAFGLKAWIATY